MNWKPFCIKPGVDLPSLMPPAAKTLFEKRVLDSQKLLIKMVFKDKLLLYSMSSNLSIQAVSAPVLRL
jgi:hypothetical protein